MIALRPYRVDGCAPIARVSPGVVLGSLTTSDLVAGGAVTGARSGIPPGAVTVPRSRRIPIFPLVSVGVGLTRGAVVGLTRGTD